MRIRIDPGGPLHGTLRVPGDKSISHRALIFAALAEGRCRIENLSPGEDVRSTARCLVGLGVPIVRDGEAVIVDGVGLAGLRTPAEPLDCGNSGTTMRLLAGVLAGSGAGGILDGDESLRRRPMKRVLAPLRAMGASCTGVRDEKNDERAPLRFDRGAWLVGRRNTLEVASAQVKSALLLAGLWADGETTVQEPALSRDHTERMLRAFGAPLTTGENEATIRRPDRPLRAPETLLVPGDPSSAAFLLGAALLVPGSEVAVEAVDANPTRTGFLRVLERMGADLSILPGGEAAGDPIATFVARGTPRLQATGIGPDEIPSLVDEVPLLAALATQAHGTTRITGAGELRVKESDRLAAMARGLRALGADVTELPDGLEIRGPAQLRGAPVDSCGDHRIAMSLAVAALAAEGTTEIAGAEWVDISFPGFFARLDALREPKG